MQFSKKTEEINTLSENEVSVTNSKKVICRKVLFAGSECIDIRIWVIWNQDREWHPTKHGLFMGMTDFRNKVLPFLNILAVDKK